MTPTKITPKDFFLHLGATVALYAAAISLINLAFSVINYFLPDQLAGYFYSSSIAWPISMLIVLVPIFYVLEWLLARDVRRVPEKAELAIRKWRIYLTMFLTGATVIGDVIALINTYLNGEITLRFVYKVIVLYLITGAIFKYYLLEIWKRWNTKLWQKVIAWFGIILVLAIIIGGFMAVGSPTKQRGLRFDSQRINDLNVIQNQVLNYWQTKEKLPVELADLTDSISGFIVPVDPETQAPYEYSVKGVMGIQGASSGLTFQLCATFSQPSQDTQGRGSSISGGVMYPVAPYPYPGGGLDANWQHEAGRTCFDRTIDPEKYKPNQTP